MVEIARLLDRATDPGPVGDLPGERPALQLGFAAHDLHQVVAKRVRDLPLTLDKLV